jgi:integrase
VLSADHVITIISRLEEPYATLVLFLAVTGVRICEAIAVKWSDFEGDLLKVQRRIYEGEADTVKSTKSNRSLPIPQSLLVRMQALGDGEWVFRSRTGTPLNPKNTLNRYIRPVIGAMGIEIGGFHDFRHTLTTKLRRGGVHPKVISGLLGHSKVDLAMDVYDHLEAEELRAPLAQIASQLNPIEPKLEKTA